MFIKAIHLNGVYTTVANGYEKPEGFVDYYKPELQLLKDRTYTIAVDPGTNNMSIVIGDDTMQYPILIFQISRDSHESGSTDFIDNVIQFFTGIVESLDTTLRSAYIEQPVYMGKKSFRTNSYSILKPLQNRLVNILQHHNIDYISKPATTWRGITLASLKGVIPMNKISKDNIRAVIMRMYPAIFKICGDISTDSCEAIGMLHYMYSFYTADDTIHISPNTPRTQNIDGSIINIDLLENSDSLIQDYKNQGYSIHSFNYCTDLNVEDNLKSLLYQAKKDKKLYFAEIENSISVMKFVANYKKLSEVYPNSKFILIGGWL